MKLLVISDTHRFLGNVDVILNKIGSAIEGIIHLGDVENDQIMLKNKYPNFKFYCVRGNNDLNGEEDDEKLISFKGKKFLLTHGHRQHVHWNYTTISYWAEENGADIVLFGHTHEPLCEMFGNLILFNPGSISLPRSTPYPTFGIIDVSDSGIIRCSVMEYEKNGNFRIIKSF